MNLLSRIFKYGILPKDSTSFSILECQKLIEIYDYINILLNENRFISKKEYLNILSNNQKTIDYFNTLKISNLIKPLCKENNIKVRELEKIITFCSNITKEIDKHNNNYINKKMIDEKDYLDNILKDIDKNIILDSDQRKVILDDEDYCLVIAGAGAGKTTTVAAKVKYLVEKKNIDPKEILVISFTNKAVDELKDKLNKDLNIPCPIATFHSTGNAILNKQNTDKLNIVDSSRLYYIILEYFKNSILKNESLVNNLILFFASYFDAPYEGNDLNDFFNKIAKSNYSTIKSDLNEFKSEIIDSRSKKKITILNEILRSNEEVSIANFLYLNGIDYIYEPLYKYNILYSRKPYTPDFIIKQGKMYSYIEHFGISQDGKNNKYSQSQLEFYKKAINDKILLHKKHKTPLIYTFSKYNDGRAIIDHLKEALEEKGFVLKPRPNKEIMEKLISTEENKYIRKLISLICRFITNFKTNGFNNEEFSRMYHETNNVRTKLFLNICNDCYLEYQRVLKENNAVDFEDMINTSAKVLREVKEMKQKLSFKYIIVDEYQDISKQRFDLVVALKEVCDAKIIAVGDDWQSIYAFSGSDINLFTNFKEKMGYASLLKIVNTYRNSQEVIDIAGNFIQKNDKQIKKELKSYKKIKDPVIIYTYDSTYKKKDANNKSGAVYELAHCLEEVLGNIINYNKEEGKGISSEVLVLGRFGFDKDKLEYSGLFECINKSNKLRSIKYPYLNITYMTAHASKGLGYDNVIIINGKNETYGFPSKIEDDPVLSFVVKTDKSIEYAEERRLFYVAMTRTKNRVFFIAPEQNPSEFLLEIKKEYKNIKLKGRWNENQIIQNNTLKLCPLCSYPLQYRYKNAYGLRLYICTNDKEMCGFMTNELKAGKLSIMKCDACTDGYLVVKSASDNSFFLGCTNYKKDGTGCSNTMSMKEYYNMMRYKFEIPKSITVNRQIPKVSSNEQIKQNIIHKNNILCINKSNINGFKYLNNELDDIIYNTLNTLLITSEEHYYTQDEFLDILLGSKNKTILKYKLNESSNFGILKYLSRESLIIILEFLIENHYILKTKNTRKQVLHPTHETSIYGNTLTKNKLKALLNTLTNQKE